MPTADGSLTQDEFQERITRARMAGATWDQINTGINQRIAAARKAGATDAQIRTAFGGVDPSALDGRLAANVQSNLHEAPPPSPTQNPYEAFVNGLQQSSGGMLVRNTAATDKVLAPNADGWSRAANVVGNVLGDLPVQIGGSMLVGLAGAATGGGGGAAVPGAGETGVSEAGGALGGGAIGMGVGFALPAIIKSEYAQALERGEVTGPRDFAIRQAKALWEGAKGFTLGVTTGGAGSYAARGVEAVGGNALAQGATRLTAEGVTMASVQAAMEGHLPSQEEIADSVVMVVGMHGAMKISSASLGAVRKNLMNNWVQTNESPADAARRAITDPQFRARLMGTIQTQPVARGSSQTSVTAQLGEAQARPQGPTDTDHPIHEAIPPAPQERAGIRTPVTDVRAPVDNVPSGQPTPNHDFVIGRADGGIDHVRGVMRVIEGGLTKEGAPRTSPAGAVGENQMMWYTAKRFGLQGSQEDIERQLRDPEVNRAVSDRYLTYLYHRYGGDEEAMLAAYNGGERRGDALQHAGPGTRLESYVDPRTGKHEYTKVQAERDESKLPLETQKYLADARRVAKGQLSGSAIDGVSHTPDNTEEITSPIQDYAKEEEAREAETEKQVEEDQAREGTDQAELDAMRGKNAAGKGGGGAPDFSGQALASIQGYNDLDYSRGLVRGQLAPSRAGPTFVEKLWSDMQQAYREIFRPEAAVTKLWEAATAGTDVPDTANQHFLRRLAENSGQRTHYFVKLGQLDIHGNVVGKGLEQILAPIQKAKLWGLMEEYMASKWGLMRHLQGKETGIDLDAAADIIRNVEANGLQLAGEDLGLQAKRTGTTVNWMPKDHPLMALIGPHFHIGRNEVNMPDMSDGEYEQAFGTGMTRDVVLAHELGHAAAHSMSEKVQWIGGTELGRGFWDHALSAEEAKNLETELTIVSKQFKPALWDEAMQRQHVTKNSELIADGFATWMTDPLARTRMPEFQKVVDRLTRDPAEQAAILEQELHGEISPKTQAAVEKLPASKRGPQFDLQKEMGAIPTKWGTPIQQAFDELVQWQNSTLKYALDGGIISRDAYIQAVATNRYRIPGYREVELEGKSSTTLSTGKGQVGYNPMREFKGSTLPIKQIVRSLIQEGYQRVELANKNRANLKLVQPANELARLGLAEKRGTPVHFDVMRAMADAREAGVSDDNMSALAKAISGANGAIRQDEVPIFRDGRMERWTFSDPAATNYLRGYDQIQSAIWQRWASKLSKVYRAGTVINPLFGPHLLTYDLPWQFITKPGFQNTVGQMLNAIPHMLAGEKSEQFREWWASGGAENVLGAISHDDFIKKQIRDLGPEDPNPWHAVPNAVLSGVNKLQAWTTGMGHLLPLGKYMEMRAAGASRIKAGVGAQDAAFHRSGFGGPALRQLNALHPFWGAYFNSLEQTFRSQFGIGKTATGEKFNGLQFTAKAMMTITSLSVGQWLMDKDKEWYKNADQWKKDNGLLFHFGPDDGSGHTFFLGFPPIIGFWYGGLPKRMLQAFFEHDPHAFDEFGTGVLASFTPPGGLTLAGFMQPLMENMLNKSFQTGRPIYNDEQQKNLDPAYQTQRWSSGTARAVSQAIQFAAPWQVDHLIQGWGGEAGKAAVQAADMALGTGPSAKDQPTPGVEDWPLLSQYLASDSRANGQAIRSFQDASHKIDREHGDLLSDLEANDRAKFMRDLNRDPNAATLHMFRLAGDLDSAEAAQRMPWFRPLLEEASQRADKADVAEVIMVQKGLKQAYKYVDRVWINPNYTADDKRQMIMQTYHQMQIMTEEGQRAMDRAGMGGVAPQQTERNPEAARFRPPVPGV